VDITEALDCLYTGKTCDLSHLTQGVAFLRQLAQDQVELQALKERFKKGLQFTPKREHLVGEGLPLSVVILNRHDDAPAIKTWVGEATWLVIYFGICPELENSVSIVMWPSRSHTSQDTYRRIVELVEADYTWLRLEGKYQLELPNQIHPAWISKVHIAPDEERFYGWPLFPFLAEIRDAVGSFISPVNYRKVLVRQYPETGGYDGPYVNLKVVAGVFIQQMGHEIEVMLPFEEDKRPFLMCLSEYSPERIHLERGECYSFLVLERPDRKVREVYRVQRSNPVGLVAHRMAAILYRKVLKTRQLKLGTPQELKELYRDSVENIAVVCRRDSQSLLAEPFMRYEMATEYYLGKFLRNIKGAYYYMPRPVWDLSDRAFLILNDALTNYRYEPEALHRVTLGNLYWQVQLTLDIKRLITKQSIDSPVVLRLEGKLPADR